MAGELHFRLERFRKLVGEHSEQKGVLLRSALAWLREQLQRIQLKRLWQVATVVVLGVAAGFGGLEQASTAKPIELDQAYTNGPLRITPHAVVEKCGQGEVPFVFAHVIAKGKSIIGLRATIESLVNEDLKFDQNNRDGMFGLEGGAEDSFMGIVPKGEREPVKDIAAGTTVDADILWQIPPEWPADSHPVIINIYDLEERPQEFLPVVQWTKTDRAIHGQLKAPMIRC